MATKAKQPQPITIPTPIKLYADPDAMAERGINFLWVPRHPIINADAQTVGFRHGKVLPGQTFNWWGDPKKPPRCSVPADQMAAVLPSQPVEMHAAKSAAAGPNHLGSTVVVT